MRTSVDGPATLADVAALAEVSLKTASRVFNGEPHVADRTRAKVLGAARELSFQMNAPASMLRRGIGAPEVALVIGDITNPFFAALARGAEGEARRRGGFLTLASSDESDVEEIRLIQEFARRHVRGIVIASTLADHLPLDFVRERGAALVFVDRPPVGIEADSVLLDNVAGARMATEHLLAHGHRRIAFVGDYERLATHRERMQGFGSAMDAAGITHWRSNVHEGAHDAASARELVASLLGRQDAPTAVLASNNRIAVGAVSAIGLAGPGTAIIGFDDFDLAEVLGVTTVTHDPTEMGRLAIERVFHAAADPAARAEQFVLPTRLVVRGSGEIAPPA